MKLWADFRGVLGDRAVYIDFRCVDDLSYQAGESNRVGVKPVGVIKQGF
jgi:hypothetical protein